MQNFFIIIISCFSGIIAGMGMGGGTFLIPALSIFFGFSQVLCQATNVFSFVILAIICIVIYTKNKLIDFKLLFLVSIPAAAIACLFTLLSINLSSKVLKICFSIFIILFGIFNLVKTIISIKKSKSNTKQPID